MKQKSNKEILPNELFFDIFMSINTDNYITIQNSKIETSYKYWWNNCIKNILKSSSIIYKYIGMYFLKRKNCFKTKILNYLRMAIQIPLIYNAKTTSNHSFLLKQTIVLNQMSIISSKIYLKLLELILN
uniref:Uncharacterized protein n=1 Tax=Meloidogyne enterolobii TaxID=390850 RepID=A0A6V7UA65_MELEN|nr:unnamed protein product [Meloidogyne enterolobii]